MYNHKHLKGFSCEIIAPTKKGFKVLEKNPFNKKGKIAYYNKDDFHPQNGFWVLKETND